MSPLPQGHPLPRPCSQPPDSPTTSSPPPSLTTFPSSPIAFPPGGQRELPDSPAPLKVRLEAFCDGDRRGRNVGWVEGGGKLPTTTMMTRALGLGHSGECRMTRSAPRAARCCEAVPCPWGTQRSCVGLLRVRHGEGKTRRFLGYPMHWCLSPCMQRQERSEEHTR